MLWGRCSVLRTLASAENIHIPVCRPSCSCFPIRPMSVHLCIRVCTSAQPLSGLPYSIESCYAGFFACGGTHKRRISIPPQCNPAWKAFFHKNPTGIFMKKNRLFLKRKRRRKLTRYHSYSYKMYALITDTDLKSLISSCCNGQAPAMPTAFCALSLSVFTAVMIYTCNYRRAS